MVLWGPQPTRKQSESAALVGVSIERLLTALD
eukprot:COSAG02_NODE_52968_length_304_cov_1.765854_1_plen_31_part_01